MTENEIHNKIAEIGITSSDVLIVLIKEEGEEVSYFGKIEFDENNNPVLNNETIGVRIQKGIGLPFHLYAGGLKVINLLNFAKND